jgi:hypothetical protein
MNNKIKQLLEQYFDAAAHLGLAYLHDKARGLGGAHTPGPSAPPLALPPEFSGTPSRLSTYVPGQPAASAALELQRQQVEREEATRMARAAIDTLKRMSAAIGANMSPRN